MQAIVSIVVGTLLLGTAYMVLLAVLTFITPVLIWTCVWLTFLTVMTVLIVRTLTRKVRKSR